MQQFTIVLLAVLVGALSTPCRAAADGLPTLEDLRAKIAAAAGTVPDPRFEQVRSTAFGVAGTQTTFHAGEDFRETDVSGPLVSAHGRYHHQAWHQNANGQTVLEQPDPGRSAADTYVTTVSRVSAPFDAYVIARLNGARSGVKEYVDPTTYRIVRRDEIRPTETTVFTYDDFRTVAGYTTAWHWTRRDGHPENNGEYQIETFVARPIAADEIDVAPPRRALVEFPPGKTSVELPVQMVQQKFVVRVVINGRGLDLVLDSGSAGITLEEGVVRQLGLTSVGRYSSALNAGRVDATTVVVPEMQVGDLRMHDVAVTTLPDPGEQVAGVKVVGLLGFDFIAELGLRLDYEHGRVTAIHSDQPLVISEPGAIVLDIRLGKQVPFADVTINGALGERFIIDTGAAGSLMIADYFARRYPTALVDRGGGGAGRFAQFAGVGGAIDTRPYQLARVQLGSVTFADFVAYRVVERKSYESSSDGFLGAQLLRYFTVWLDYVDSQIVLVPNADGRRAMH
jgi:hypothetical protein